MPRIDLPRECQLPPEREPQFQFAAFWVDSVNFATLPLGERDPGEIKPESQIFQYFFKLGAGINRELLRSQITMEVRLVGDPKWQPYDITVTLTGRFATVEGTATADELDSFTRVNAPIILFPYVREIVHRLTADAQYGIARLHPINLPSILPNWEPVTTSSEQAQPSEQSPSVEKR